MKLFAAILLFFVSNFAIASTYRLENQIQFGSKKYSNSMIIESGKSSEVSPVTEATGDGYKMNVTATPVADAKGPVKLEYQLTRIQNGKEKSVGKPTIITLLGEEATVEAGDVNKSPDFKLSVVVEQMPTKK